MFLVFVFSLDRLNNSSITAEGCVALTSAFNSNPSNLIELDLCGNKLENSGIKKICPLLENKQCRLEKLKCVLTLFQFILLIYNNVQFNIFI